MTDERQKYMQLKQQVLPFDFWEEENQAAAQKQQNLVASLPHYPEPKTDNEKLLEWQWQYKHGDQQALIKIYDLSITICRKFINHIGQYNPHIKELSLPNIKQKAEDAATYLIERYIQKPNFVITKNYPGYLYLRVLHELYYLRKADKIQTFIDITRIFKESEEAALPDLWTHVKFEDIDAETEEDQEQRELKQYYMWKKKQNKGDQDGNN